MAKARGRCLPMNFTMEDATCGIIKERARIGSSLADVDPMNINTKVHISLLSVSALTFLFHNNNNNCFVGKRKLCMPCTVTVAFVVSFTLLPSTLVIIFSCNVFTPSLQVLVVGKNVLMQRINVYKLSHHVNFINDFHHQLRKHNCVKFAKALNHCFNLRITLLKMNKFVNYCKQLRRSLEVGCRRHPEASTIGSQL